MCVALALQLRDGLIFFGQKKKRRWSTEQLTFLSLSPTKEDGAVAAWWYQVVNILCSCTETSFSVDMKRHDIMLWRYLFELQLAKKQEFSVWRVISTFSNDGEVKFVLSLSFEFLDRFLVISDVSVLGKLYLTHHIGGISEYPEKYLLEYVVLQSLPGEQISTQFESVSSFPTQEEDGRRSDLKTPLVRTKRNFAFLCTWQYEIVFPAKLCSTSHESYSHKVEGNGVSSCWVAIITSSSHNTGSQNFRWKTGCWGCEKT